MRTLDEWVDSVRSVTPDRRFRVARRCYDLEQAGSDRACVWHASHELYVEDLANGLVDHGTCRFCGGRTMPSQGDEHAMCAARATRGGDTPRLDSMATECDCMPCRNERSV